MITIEKELQDYFRDTCSYDTITERWFYKSSLASGRKKYVTPAQIFSEYISLISKLHKTCSTTIADFEDYVKRATPIKETTKCYFKELPQISNWIYEQLTIPTCPFDISKKFDMINFRSNDNQVSTGDKAVVGWLNCRAADLGLSKVYKVGLMSAGWDMLKLKMASDCIKMLKESIKYNEANVSITDSFIRSIYDYLQIKERYEIFEMLFKHWCWTLKRHIWNRHVTWQIWINFYGAQGIGKSEMIRRMFKFIRDFMAETSLSAFNDVERQYKLFTDTYVLYFDELNKGDNKDAAVEMVLNSAAVDSIKDMMTKDIITVRQYQTQDQAKFRNQFTPISAANNHLYDIVYDGEAMRRWFDFTCCRQNPPESYDEINNILATFQDALKGIDEDKDEGYWIPNSEIGKEIFAIQKTYIPTNTSTNSWINYCSVKPDNEHLTANIFNAKLYSEYSAYCKSVGRGKASMDRVAAILKRLWPEAVDANGNVYVTSTKVISEGTETVKINDCKEEFTF